VAPFRRQARDQGRVASREVREPSNPSPIPDSEPQTPRKRRSSALSTCSCPHRSKWKIPIRAFIGTILYTERRRTISEATEAGDLKTARIAHEALGKLLDAPGGASVVELSSVKRGRG